MTRTAVEMDAEEFADVQAGEVTCAGCWLEMQPDLDDAGERFVYLRTQSGLVCDGCAASIKAAYPEASTELEVEVEDGDGYAHGVVCPECGFSNEKSIDGPGTYQQSCRACGAVFNFQAVPLN